MSTKREYYEFICEQLSDCDAVSYRPMMGEYILYYEGKVVGGLHDDRFLIKPTKGAKSLLPSRPSLLPMMGERICSLSKRSRIANC